MIYKINPLSYRDVITLPSCVSERLKLAGLNHLRFIIWAFSKRTDSVDSLDAQKELKLSEQEISEAVIFWREAGLFLPEDSSVKAYELARPEEQKTKASKPHRSPEKPTREEAVKRGTECEEIRFMLPELQKKLRRTINSNELASFVWMYDSLGIPAEVILMLVQYCVSQDKTNIRYMEKTASEWASKDIDSIEKAEKALKDAIMSREACGKVMRAFGIEPRQPSEKELYLSNVWVNEWGFSSKMLKAAYDECIDHSAKLSFAYINKILASWHQKGFKAPEDTKKDVKSAKYGKEKSSSLDISEFSKELKRKTGRGI